MTSIEERQLWAVGPIILETYPEFSLGDRKNLIILCLMAKDERHNIIPILENMRPWCDAVALVGGGKSTDETMTKGLSYLRDNRIPHIHFTNDWTKWCDNRNSVLRGAQFLSKRLISQVLDIKLSDVKGQPLILHPSDYQRISAFRVYGCTIDCDNRVVITSNLSDEETIKNIRDNLVFDYYNITTIRGTGLRYPMIFLFRLDPLDVCNFGWRYSPHEIVGSVCPYYFTTYGTLQNCHMNSGSSGNRARDPLSVHRDIIDFEKYLRCFPNDSRTLHYLAHCYECLGLFDKSITLAEQYQKISTFQDEKYLSLIRTYKMKKILYPDDPETYLEPVYEAYELDRDRVEAAHYLCEYFMSKKRFHLAWQIVKPFVNIDHTKNLKHFLDLDIHEIEFFEPAALAAYYSSDKEGARKLFLRILESSKIPNDLRERTIRNLKFTPPTVTELEEQQAKIRARLSTS